MKKPQVLLWLFLIKNEFNHGKRKKRSKSGKH